MAEKHDFRMHPHMLYDVIRRQAGTLIKAIFELVMNAVDAKAENIEITLNTKSVRVVDDGTGMTDKKHIQTYWRTFGQPPEEHEKKTYGQFRMGRGQAFAFGKNTWRTSQFKMDVDIRGRGLEYDLHEKLAEKPGCDVQIELYDPIRETDICDILRDLPIGIKYVPAKITLNKKVISLEAPKQKWDQETDEAYVKLRDTGNLYVYNRGVLVTSHSNRTFGCGGEVVSKQQLTVNFARNEVMSTCPVWKKIKPLVDKRAKERITRAPALNDGSRQRLIDQLLSGDLDVPSSAKLLTDACGRHWAIGLVRPDAFNGKLTIGEHGSQKADRLMQMKLGFVLSEHMLEQFRVDSLDELYHVLCSCPHRFDAHREFNIVPFKDLTAKMKETYRIIPEANWTVQETIIIKTIRRAMYRLLSYQYERRAAQDSEEFDDEIRRSTRALYIGESDCAHAWTDGEQFIAIDRKFIAKTGIDLEAWISYGQVMIHELSHDESDQGTHIHGQDFYERYHDWTMKSLHEFVGTALHYFPSIVRGVEGAYNKNHARQIDRVTKVTTAATKVAGVKEQTVRR
jgi:hypothetical protein